MQEAIHDRLMEMSRWRDFMFLVGVDWRVPFTGERVAIVPNDPKLSGRRRAGAMPLRKSGRGRRRREQPAVTARSRSRAAPG